MNPEENKIQPQLILSNGCNYRRSIKLSKNNLELFNMNENGLIRINVLNENNKSVEQLYKELRSAAIILYLDQNGKDYNKIYHVETMFTRYTHYLNFSYTMVNWNFYEKDTIISGEIYMLKKSKLKFTFI